MAVHLRWRQSIGQCLCLPQRSPGLGPERQSHGRLEGWVRDDAPQYVSTAKILRPLRHETGCPLSYCGRQSTAAPSGVRIWHSGAPAMATRGLREADFEEIASQLSCAVDIALRLP